MKFSNLPKLAKRAQLELSPFNIYQCFLRGRTETPLLTWKSLKIPWIGWFSLEWKLKYPLKILEFDLNLFWHVWIFFFSFLFRFVYQARHAKSKWGWMRALHRRRFKEGVKNFCLRYRNFKRPFILLSACRAIASPDRLQSRVEIILKITYLKWLKCT